MNVLVIDDDPVDQEAVRRALRKNLKVKITAVNTAHQALATLRNIQFDVVLLDYFLPEMDGLALLYEIRKIDTLGNCAIIMLSNTEDEEVAFKCLELGAMDFLSKNELTPVKLRRTIHIAKKRFELEHYVRQSFRRVRDLVSRDQLTGIHNRQSFENNVESLLQQNAAGISVSVLILDITNFKLINDHYGHDIGDLFLILIAKKVSPVVPEGACFARLGGDEFGIAFQSPDSELVLLDTAHLILETLNGNHQIRNYDIRSTYNIGVATQTDHGQRYLNIIKSADIALLHAKNTDENNICLFENEMAEQMTRRLKIEEGLAYNLDKNAFKVVYQKIVDSEMNLLGFESLVRWPEDCRFGQFYPDEFIPIAEESQEINRLGLFVFRQSVKQIKEWAKWVQHPLFMSVNVSPVQLKKAGLAEQLITVCREHQVAPSSMIIEITETALITDIIEIPRQLNQLSKAGFRIALDDFGTGYSSIAHLINYPIDIVKIDRSVLPKSSTDHKHYSILSGLAGMISSIELQTVVEGVENEWHFQLCHELGINKLQGYFIGRPESPTSHAVL